MRRCLTTPQSSINFMRELQMRYKVPPVKLRYSFIFLLATAPSVLLHGQKPNRNQQLPESFAIGRDSYFDFGPPFNYYEIILVSTSSDGVSLQRALLTPRAACISPAKLEIENRELKTSMSDLLEGQNPCLIPEKDLRRERKRCKHCMNFSGVDVTMEIHCGEKSRVIRSDILDADLYDKSTKTPKYTSWTMRLLNEIDKALGPGVAEKPVFDLGGPEKEPGSTSTDSFARDLESGKYDHLFQGAQNKVSEIAIESHKPLTETTIELKNFEVEPIQAALPQCPPIAKAANVEGLVEFSVTIDDDGRPSSIQFQAVHPMLRAAVENAVKTWRFPTSASGKTANFNMIFKTNCSR